MSYRWLEYYRQEDIENLIISSGMYDRFLAEADDYPRNLEFYESVEREGALVYEIAAVPWRTTGPAVSVHRVAVLSRSGVGCSLVTNAAAGDTDS